MNTTLRTFTQIKSGRQSVQCAGQIALDSCRIDFKNHWVDSTLDRYRPISLAKAFRKRDSSDGSSNTLTAQPKLPIQTNCLPSISSSSYNDTCWTAFISRASPIASSTVCCICGSIFSLFRISCRPILEVFSTVEFVISVYKVGSEEQTCCNEGCTWLHSSEVLEYTSTCRVKFKFNYTNPR